MSHFTFIKTQITEKNLLAKALVRIGYSPEQGLLPIKDYFGGKTKVEIRILTAKSNKYIGFRKAGESYEVVADWWGISELDRTEFIQELTQSYAYCATREKLEEQGFSVASEQTQPDGRIHLVLRRMT